MIEQGHAMPYGSLTGDPVTEQRLVQNVQVPYVVLKRDVTGHFQNKTLLQVHLVNLSRNPLVKQAVFPAPNGCMRWFEA